MPADMIHLQSKRLLFIPWKTRHSHSTLNSLLHSYAARLTSVCGGGGGVLPEHINGLDKGILKSVGSAPLVWRKCLEQQMHWRRREAPPPTPTLGVIPSPGDKVAPSLHFLLIQCEPEAGREPLSSVTRAAVA